MPISSSLLTIISTQLAEQPANAPAPWWARSPNPGVELPVTLMTVVLKAAVVASAWALFVAPLGVPTLSLWSALGLCLFVTVLRTRGSTHAALVRDQQMQALNATVSAAQRHAFEHAMLALRLVGLLVLWGMIVLVGYFA